MFCVTVWVQDKNVRFIDGHDEKQSHLIFAGSDIILCQSFHDPVLQVPVSSLFLFCFPACFLFTFNCNSLSFSWEVVQGSSFLCLMSMYSFM